MLTRTGWLTVVAVAGAMVAGRLFGILELFLVAGVLGVLVLSCFVWVRLSTARLRVRRVVHPAKVHVGEATKVEISASNMGQRRTPVLHLSDPVAGTSGAHLHLAPLDGGETSQAAYRLPTDKRGVITVGPLTLEISDPFGLARRRAEAAPIQSLTIYPHIDPIIVPSLGGDEDPNGATIQTNKLGQTTVEFFALREYVRGDDLRRVHWKSTARSNELMVREDETRWQDRSTVALDLRPETYDADAFERAVSAAASIVSAAFRQRHLVRLLSSDGFDSGAGSGVGHAEAILGYLAGAQPKKASDRINLFDRLSQTAEGGFVSLVTGDWPGSDVEVLTALRSRFRRVVLVATFGSAPAGMPPGTVYVDMRADIPFGQAWQGAGGRLSRTTSA